MILVCHVILKDHMIIFSCDFMRRTHSSPKFHGHRHRGIEDIIVLVCLMILQDCIIKGSCDFMVEIPSW